MGIISSAISSGQQAAAANKQMNFQKTSMQNRWQWQVQDMRKAGINPMLAFGGGSAGAPPSAQGAMAKPNIQFDDDAVSTAKQAKEILANIKKDGILTTAKTAGQDIANKVAAAAVPRKVLEEELSSDFYETASDVYKGAKSWIFGGEVPSGSAKGEAKRHPHTYDEALESRRHRDEPRSQRRTKKEHEAWKRRQRPKAQKGSSRD